MKLHLIAVTVQWADNSVGGSKQPVNLYLANWCLD
jgi:hypothetical protein